MSDEDPAAASSGKLKLMCLHGFLQTGSVFRMRTGSLRKALKSRLEFVFVDAPFHAASTLTPEQVARFGGSSEGLTWFQWQDLGPDKRPSLAVKYARWDETYASLCAALREQRPDGLLGFSQGATAVALFLAALAEAQAAGRDLDVPAPRFCIVCAGFLPNDPDYAALLSRARVATPALFITGRADGLIPPARTKALMDTFDPAAAELFEHPGAHFVPTCSGKFKECLVAFLDRQREPGGGSNNGGGSVSAGSSLEEPADEVAEDAPLAAAEQ